MNTPLISVTDLSAMLAAPCPPVVLDVRYRLGGPPGHPEYEAAHVPGAAYVDMDAELAGTPGVGGAGGRHPMPAAGTFQAAMRRAGVTTDRTVVCYDDWNSLPASRAWWLLRYFGHRDVRVLDGGISAWRAAGSPVETGDEQVRTAGDFTAVPGGRTLLDAAGAAELATTGRLLDGRPRPRFHGQNETVDPVAGHIPGAVSAPALENVQADGRLLPASDLRAKLAAAVHPTAVHPTAVQIGTYCGSGIQAAHLALALEVAGLSDDPAVYTGSWSDWISDPTRPVDPT